METTGPARRVVSLTPSNTEILWALGGLHHLVGADEESDFPPGLRVERVGRDLQIDAARVAALKPDLILASLSVPGMEKVVEDVRALGIETLVLAPKTIAEVFEDHVKVGEALGIEPKAHAVVAEMTKRLQAVRAATAAAPKVRVYWEWWPNPIMTAGARSWMTGLIQLAGGLNVFADVDAETITIREDALATRAPDAIAFCWCGTLQRKLDTGAARIKARKGWDKLAPFKTDRVWPLDEGLFGRPGPRLIEGLELLAWLLHPGKAPPPATSAVRGVVPREGKPVVATTADEIDRRLGLVGGDAPEPDRDGDG